MGDFASISYEERWPNDYYAAFFCLKCAVCPNEDGLPLQCNVYCNIVIIKLAFLSKDIQKVSISCSFKDYCTKNKGQLVGMQLPYSL